MRRVSISELVRYTGLSRATVDRAMNSRGGVHRRTLEIIDDAIKILSHTHASSIPTQSVDIVVRVGRGMAKQLESAWNGMPIDSAFHDVYPADESAMLSIIDPLCDDLSRPLIITAKNTQRLTDRLREARLKGKRIIALVSDLASDARDGFVGIDDRAAGQTAAYLIGCTLGDRPTTVAVVVGDTAFRCHEDREIGFRTGLRANYPKIVLRGEARGEDSPAKTREAVLQLLLENPAIGAIYNVGGGNKGLVEAAAEAGRSDDLLIVAHEANEVTVPLLRENKISFTLAANPADQLREAVRLATMEAPDGNRDVTALDFSIYTQFNLPAFATPQ